jgi:hypothetical protein
MRGRTYLLAAATSIAATDRPSVVLEQDKKDAGTSVATGGVVQAKARLIDGWKVRSWLDWTIAMLSFVLFVIFESAIIYSYWVFLGHLN